MDMGLRDSVIRRPLSCLALAVVTSLPAASTPARAPLLARSPFAIGVERVRDDVHRAWLRQLKWTQPTQRHRDNLLIVTSCADDGTPGTLRSVVETANAHDTVDLTHLTCSKITLTQGAIVDNPNAFTLTIQGPGMDALTISGAASSSVFYHSGLGTLAINDLSISDGYAVDSWGGCLLAPHGGLALTRVRVSDCKAYEFTSQHGTFEVGGAAMSFTEMTLTDSIITNSRLGSEVMDGSGGPYTVMGGAVFTYAGPLSISGSTIQEGIVFSTEQAYGFIRGGGATCYCENGVVANSVIAGNTLQSAFIGSSAASGAGIDGRFTTLAISNSTISNNSIVVNTPLPYVFGGGLVTGNGSTITGSTIALNSVPGRSGGIEANGDLSITNSTLSGNYSQSAGSAITSNYTLEIANTTIAFNSSGTGIGGVSAGGATTLLSTIISQNTGNALPSDIQTFGQGSITGDHNLISAPVAGTSVPPDTLSGDPNLQPLADNGGPTLTLGLASDSIAIDSGANPLALEFDQRGDGYPRVSGAAADIGAFEYSVNAPPVASDDSYEVVENTTLNVNAPGVLSNDFDPDGDPLTAILISGPSNGTLTLNSDGSFVYVPTGGFFGTDSFTYEASDGQQDSPTAVVAITVTQDTDTIFANGFD